MKYLLLIFIILFSVNNLFSQTTRLYKIMYVTPRAGLNQRSEPSINGERIGALMFGQRIVVNIQGPEATIDGITDHWYGILIQPSRVGQEQYRWIFGGYLSEELPLDAPVIFGLWDNLDSIDLSYRFDPDGYYSFSLKETGNAQWGKWELDNNILTITLTHSNLSGLLVTLNEVVTIRLNEIDRNNIILIYPNGDQLKLTRDLGLFLAE